MGRKSTAEVEARRLEVYEMMMQGKNINFIVSYCNTNWGVKRSAVEKDMIAVRQDLLKEFQQEKQEIIATHVARYEKLYEFYMDEGEEGDLNIHFNPETASKMLEKKEKLLRLHNPDVVVNNNTLNNLNLENMSLDELQRILSQS